jgi:hypothetical protein
MLANFAFAVGLYKMHNRRLSMLIVHFAFAQLT